MMVAHSHPHRVFGVTRTLHDHSLHTLLPGWAVVLVYAALLAILIASAWFVFRAAKRMSKPGRIVVAVIAVWTIVGASVAFLDGYRPSGDWGGGIFEGSVMVFYGVVAAAIVLGVDRAVRRFRPAAPV